MGWAQRWHVEAYNGVVAVVAVVVVVAVVAVAAVVVQDIDS